MNTLERVALGSIGVEGSYEIVTTDPLTGRVYQRIAEKNLVCAGVESWLRSLCAAALSSVGAETNTYGAPMLSSNVFSEGSSYIRPVGAYVYLTDGTRPADPLNWRLDGDVIANGDTATSVAAGTTKGAFNMGASRASTGSVYRRWDWASTSGNGTMSKIALTMDTMRGLILQNTGYMSSKNAPTFEGTCMGTIGNEVWYAQSNTGGTTAVLTIIKYVFDGEEFIPETMQINLPPIGSYYTSSGLTSFSTFWKEDTDEVYIFPLHLNNAAYYGYWIYSRETGNITPVGPFTGAGSISSGNPCLGGAPYPSGEVYILRRNTPGLEVILLRDGTGTLLGQPLPLLIVGFNDLKTVKYDNGILYVYPHGGTGYRVDPVSMTTATHEWRPFGGYNVPITMPDGRKLIVMYRSTGANYRVQVEPVASWFTPFYLCTERVLSTPVIKDGQSMYVGYTLNFV